MDNTTERTLYKIFEETTTKNVQAAITFSNETREIVRNLEHQIQELKDLVINKDKELAQIRIQLSAIQAKLYRGGTD